jgi:hypothetical protein
VTFKDRETHVGLDIMRRGYQRANSTVHRRPGKLTHGSLNARLVDAQLRDQHRQGRCGVFRRRLAAVSGTDVGVVDTQRLNWWP